MGHEVMMLKFGAAENLEKSRSERVCLVRDSLKVTLVWVNLAF
jgi:hypothetical protein